jgi:hypothetical protein
VSTEVEVAAPVPVTPVPVTPAQAAEHELLVATVKASLVAVPICVVIWLGLVALALAIAGSGNFVVVLPMAGGIGIVAGVFFGGWAAFLAKAHLLDEVDRDATRPPA